jgi:Kdo2-lipid IVA lauroyltransferase/acyltransferase
MDDVTAGTAAERTYVHSFRRNFLSCERTYRLQPDGLEWSDEKSVHLVAYGDIVEIHEYKGKVRGALAAQLPRSFDYVVRCRDGERLILNSIHRPRFGVAESRASSCTSLVDELRRRVSAANPAMQSFNDLRWSYKLANAATRLWYRAGLVLFMLIRRTDIDRTANFVGRMAQWVGPHLRGHRTARANLMAAYPDMPPAEIERTLSTMWGNLGRLAIEYVNLDRLVDNANPNGGRIVVTPGTLEILRRLRDDGKPAVLFTSHLASYELGAIWVKSNGLDLAIFYNPSNFGPLSEELAAMQAKTMGRLVPSGADTVWKLREAMKEGLHLTLFADQHFARGVEVTFFDRLCKANPMAARFAQFFDCPVHGFRSIRLPGNRVQVEFTDEVAMPRDAAGKIDIQAAMQKITGIVEGWVRERPEQWLWLQRRWR